jgi:prevent-host-death family protein
MEAGMVGTEMKERVVTASEFKAKCLAFLDEMEQRSGTITITRRGRPVAVLSPPKKDAWKSPRNSWAGKARIAGEIVNAEASLWEVLRED